MTVDLTNKGAELCSFLLLSLEEILRRRSIIYPVFYNHYAEGFAEVDPIQLAYFGWEIEMAFTTKSF